MSDAKPTRFDNVLVSGDVEVIGDAIAGGFLDNEATGVTGVFNVAGNFSVATNKLTVAAASGNTAIAGTCNVVGNLSVATNKLTVAAASGNTLIAGTCSVTGDLAVATNKLTVAAATGNTLVAGTLAVTGDVAVATNKLTVAAATGNTVVAGTLGVTGLVSFDGGGTNPALKMTGAGSKSGAGYTTPGSAWADDGTPAFVASQPYLRVYLGATVYRVPLFADA